MTVAFPFPDESYATDVRIADSKHGVYMVHTTGYAASGSDKPGARVHVNESLIVGYSRWRSSFGCGTYNGIYWSSPEKKVNVTGLWMPFLGTQLGPKGSCKCCVKSVDPMKKPAGLVKQGEVHVTDVAFAGFDGRCETRTYALHINPNSLDHNHPSLFRQIQWHDVSTNHKLHMPPPPITHINLGGCFTMDCGGHINALFLDVDGTLTGTAGASVVARAEDLSPVRSNLQPTPYRIPAKLLYDPWPSDRRRRRLSEGDDAHEGEWEANATDARVRRQLQGMAPDAYVKPCDPTMAMYDLRAVRASARRSRSRIRGTASTVATTPPPASSCRRAARRAAACSTSGSAGARAGTRGSARPTWSHRSGW